MKFYSLVSGSSGNASLISSGRTNILIDCGISAKKTDALLREAGLSGGLNDIDALFVTHEHSDHIRGIKRVMSAYSIPVYGSEGTLDSLAKAARDEYFNYAGRELMESVRADFEISIGDISITPFNIYHDAAEPLAYRFECCGEGGSRAAALMTDCGHFDDYICDHLKELDALILEANHDLKLLADGPYPMMLKRRILSGIGHLSNPDSGKLLSKICGKRLKSVRLGHLSRENNEPQLAVKTVRESLIASGLEAEAAMLSLEAASPELLTEVYCDEHD